jgi:hypothetical protein
MKIGKFKKVFFSFLILLGVVAGEVVEQEISKTINEPTLLISFLIFISFIITIYNLVVKRNIWFFVIHLLIYYYVLMTAKTTQVISNTFYDFNQSKVVTTITKINTVNNFNLFGAKLIMLFLTVHFLFLVPILIFKFFKKYFGKEIKQIEKDLNED